MALRFFSANTPLQGVCRSNRQRREDCPVVTDSCGISPDRLLPKGRPAGLKSFPAPSPRQPLETEKERNAGESSEERLFWPSQETERAEPNGPSPPHRSGISGFRECFHLPPLYSCYRKENNGNGSAAQPCPTFAMFALVPGLFHADFAWNIRETEKIGKKDETYKYGRNFVDNRRIFH